MFWFKKKKYKFLKIPMRQDLNLKTFKCSEIEGKPIDGILEFSYNINPDNTGYKVDKKLVNEFMMDMKFYVLPHLKYIVCLFDCDNYSIIFHALFMLYIRGSSNVGQLWGNFKELESSHAINIMYDFEKEAWDKIEPQIMDWIKLTLSGGLKREL